MTASGSMYLKAVSYLCGGGAVRPADIAAGLRLKGMLCAL